MKSILLLIGKLVVNVILIALAWIVYKKYVQPITASTVTPDHFQEIIGILILMIGLPLLTLKPFQLIKPFSFGIVSMMIPLVLFLVFYVNKAGSMSNYQRVYPIEEKQTAEQDLMIGVYIYEKSGRVHYRIPNNDCIRLDSVRIQIQNGLLGMQIVTDELNLFKKPDCGG